jgi:hypothetical protein
MPTPSLVVWLVVLLIGLPSMLKNWTAVALVFSWLTGVAWSQVTGEGLPLQGDILRDCAVLIVIFTKVHNGCDPSPGPWGWLRDCWPHTSRWDKVVVILLLPMWATYAFALNPWAAYWILWTAGLLQFFAAGAEALGQWRRGRARAEADNPTDLPMSRQGIAVNEC